MKERQQDSAARAELRTESASGGAAEQLSEARGLSQTIRDPARRKRKAATKSRCKEGPVEPDGRKSNANGSDGDTSSLIEPTHRRRANGKRNGFDKSDRELAASDDASGTTFAGDAGTPSTAACIGREACAEVALPHPVSHGGQVRCSEAVAHDEESGTDDERRPRACDDLTDSGLVEAKRAHSTEEHDDAPLAIDAPGFVDEMHARVNLYAVGQELLKDGDLKLKQRTWEYLLEMKYGKGAAIPTEEATRIDFGDLPRPQR